MKGDLTNDFSRHEFACKCGCGLDNISTKLVDKLQLARDAVGLPFVIQSGVRCKKHNASEGGEDKSSHLSGLAADILCPSSKIRYRMLITLIHLFTRIGIGATFIHVDIDETKPPEVIWLY